MATRYGHVRKLANSQSLYELGDACRVYFRYSKLHGNAVGFYGLRRSDLRQLEARPAFICFLWDNQSEPLFVPFSEFEEVFDEATPASDDQYKVQIYVREDAVLLYIARAGRFNVEGHFGWNHIDEAMQGRTY